MQAIILAILMGGRTWCAAFFVGSMLLAGNAMADAKKGVPTKLVPPTRVELPPAPPVTPVVLSPPKPPLKCEWVPQTVVTQTPGHSVFLSGITASVCGCCGPSFISTPAIFATAPGSETVTVSYVQVCQ